MRIHQRIRVRVLTLRLAGLLLCALGWTTALWAAGGTPLQSERALLKACQITLPQLKPLAIESTLVEKGRAKAIICHADEPAWREAAGIVQKAISDATGVSLPLKTDRQLTAAEFAANNVILLGHLNNNRWVARLYHNFFVCLDTGFTGRTGYEIRSVHDPFGTGHNEILVGGSFAEGTRKAAETFAALIRREGRKDSLTLGRLLELKFDPQDCVELLQPPLSDRERDEALAGYRALMFRPGQAGSAVTRMVECGLAYHRHGDLARGQIYRGLMLALAEYYRTDAYINGEGMKRYDRDARDFWTRDVAIVFDLLEESGLFSDAQRLEATNLLVRLGLECAAYQNWAGPDAVRRWAANRDVAHNHLTFPALSILFAGNYLKRHYHAPYADDWLRVARGVFNGQKHSSKPQEDAALYLWLPLIHTMIYSLSEGDTAFFEEGHARAAAQVALMVMDNAGNQAAFGDHEELKGAVAVGATLQMAGWYYKDPCLLWGARLAGFDHWYPLGQRYSTAVTPQVPADHVGVTVARIPQPAYDFLDRNPPQYATAANLPLALTFDKLAFRAGWQPTDEYMLLDGFGRGNHMHFDANAIISYAAGGEPLLVDGEYIKNTPKYHNSLVIIRDGRAEWAPAVTGLGRADQLDTAAYSRTWLGGYSGAQWTRQILWRPADYVLVSDEVRASQPGTYCLRCCWRPWGKAVLEGGDLHVDHPPMRLTLCNADGAAAHLETMRVQDDMPIGCLSQQLTLSLAVGQGYRFVNLFHAEPGDRPRELTIRQVDDGLAVVGRATGCDVVALGPALGKLPGLKAAAELLLLAPDRLAATGCTSLADGQELLSASSPVSIELAPALGSAVLVADRDARLKLRLKPGVRVVDGDIHLQPADAAGYVVLTLTAGRHKLRFDPFPMYSSADGVVARVAKLPTTARFRGSRAADLPLLKQAWQYDGLAPAVVRLPVASVHCQEPYEGRYGPFEKLFDGRCDDSFTSVQWPRGVRPTVTAELAEPARIRSVVLHEWHNDRGHAIGTRTLEISSDGFRRDRRVVPGAFAPVDHRTSGSYADTAEEIPVGQNARQVRLTVTPAGKNDSVYLAEMEIRGTPQGALPEITACARGDLGRDGPGALVVATTGGEIQALSGEGRPLWRFTTEDHAAVHALACIDVDGQRRSEVAYGDAAGHLGLLAADGRRRWVQSLPRFRDLVSDVRTIFPADLRGNGHEDIVCGCINWECLAYDAAGRMLWKNIFYAHSATVGLAADFDGDGRQAVALGNDYFHFNLIGSDGRLRWKSRSLGPEMTAVTSARVGDGRLPKIFVGVDSGDLHCFDRKGKELWRTNLGDRVTAIAAADLLGDGLQEIVCSAASAHVFALKSDGTQLWRRPLTGGVDALAVVNRPGRPIIIAAAGDRGLVVLDAGGRPVAHAPACTGAKWLIAAGKLVIAFTARGVVEGFELP